MKKIKFGVILLSFLLIATGCPEAFKSQTITVQKLVGDSIYEDFNEITNRKQVHKARDLLDNADWEVQVIEMTDLADYQFQFPFKSDDQGKIMSYYLWFSSDRDTVEITTDSQDYVLLSAEDSSTLLEILLK